MKALFITLGRESKDATPAVLYLGHDGDKAIAALEENGAAGKLASGFITRDPTPWRSKDFGHILNPPKPDAKKSPPKAASAFAPKAEDPAKIKAAAQKEINRQAAIIADLNEKQSSLEAEKAALEKEKAELTALLEKATAPAPGA